MPPDHITTNKEVVLQPFDFYQFKAADWREPPPKLDKYSPQKKPDEDSWFSDSPDYLPSFLEDSSLSANLNSEITPIIFARHIPSTQPLIYLSYTTQKPMTSNIGNLTANLSVKKNQIICTPPQDKLWIATLKPTHRNGYVLFDYKFTPAPYQFKAPQPDSLTRTANFLGEQSSRRLTSVGIDYTVGFFIQDRKVRQKLDVALEFAKEGTDNYISMTWDTGVRATTRYNFQAACGYAQCYSRAFMVQTRQWGNIVVTHAYQAGRRTYAIGAFCIGTCHSYGMIIFNYTRAAVVPIVVRSAPFLGKVGLVVLAGVAGYYTGKAIDKAADNGWTAARLVRRPYQDIIHHLIVDAPEGFQWKYDYNSGHYECHEIKDPMKETQEKLSQVGYCVAQADKPQLRNTTFQSPKLLDVQSYKIDNEEFLFLSPLMGATALMTQ